MSLRTPARRAATVTASSAALFAGSLAVATPGAVADSPEATDDLTRVVSCKGTVAGTGHGSHRFVLKGAGWKERSNGSSFCRYGKGAADVRVAWHKDAGSMAAMAQRVARAAKRPGFELLNLHHNGRGFDDGHADERTAVAEFTFRTPNGQKMHVWSVGDRYTALTVRAPERAWQDTVSSDGARAAHRSMMRMLSLPAYPQ